MTINNSRITIAKIGQKIDDQKEYFKERFDSIDRENRDQWAEIKSNTKFKYQAKGIIGAVGFVAGVLGAGISWVMAKLFGGS